MICIMHQAEPYGHLVVNGKPIQPAVLARMVGASPKEVEQWTCELEDAGVFDRDENGTIISRRMVRDERVRRLRAEGGKLGGNPALKDNRKVNPKDGAKVGEKVNLPANLKPTPSSSSSVSTSTPTPKEAPFRTVEDAARFARWWMAYPRKEAKAKAIKAWCKLRVNDELLDAMLSAVENKRRTEAWTKNGGAYIPHPATWLNDRRWEDETAVVNDKATAPKLCQCGAEGILRIGDRWFCAAHREAA
ncbi:MAG TPA: hypothetical protein VNK67_02920 [Burkholderiales bacterium]|nr:hypothetical protein [Burkholderiales bacterium]